MPTLYHKVGRLSRAKPDFFKVFYWAFITSAPSKPTKQAPINKNKNVIFSPFILLYIIDQHKPKPLENPEKNLIIFKTPTIGGRGGRGPHPLQEGINFSTPRLPRPASP